MLRSRSGGERWSPEVCTEHLGSSERACRFPYGRASSPAAAITLANRLRMIRSTQVVMHHFPQPERQVRHAVHRRDHFQDWQLRDRRQRVRC